MIVTDNHKQCNVLHYSWTKSRRVTRSVLAAELFVAAQGYDYGSMIRQAHNETYGRVVTMDLWVDEKCLWDCVTGLQIRTEKLLLIALATMCSSYEV